MLFQRLYNSLIRERCTLYSKVPMQTHLNEVCFNKKTFNRCIRILSLLIVTRLCSIRTASETVELNSF